MCTHAVSKSGPDKKSSEQVFPLTSQEFLLYSFSEALEGVRGCVRLWVGMGWMIACVRTVPKHRRYHQLGWVLKLFPLVLFQLLNPEINRHQHKFPAPSGISSMNKICFICPRELSVQHISDSFFVYNPVRHNMQMLFLQNQINAIRYKVGGDSPPDDKPVEPRVYYPCKLGA